MILRRILPLFAALLLANADNGAVFEAVRIADMRLATIGYRLSLSNASLCDELQPGTGLQLHSLFQYAQPTRAEVERHFRLRGTVGIEGVVSGSPAADAGVRTDDSILQIDGKLIDIDQKAADAPSVDQLAAIYRNLALRQPSGVVGLRLSRDGREWNVELRPHPICRTRFELVLNDQLTAQADGDLVQIGSKFLDSYTDEQVAVIVAHELAHNILRHRARLEAAKVNFGLLAEIGKNGRLFRQTETEADQLGVVLLANAGYDPASAARFWRGPGAKIDGGLFRARTHSGAASRAKITGEVAAAITPATPRPIIPSLLATRDQPLE